MTHKPKRGDTQRALGRTRKAKGSTESGEAAKRVGGYPGDALAPPDLRGFERFFHPSEMEVGGLLSNDPEPWYEDEFRDYYCETMLALAFLRETERGIPESDGRPCCRLASKRVFSLYPDSSTWITSPRLDAWRSFWDAGWAYTDGSGNRWPEDQWGMHETLLSDRLTIPWTEARVEHDTRLVRDKPFIDPRKLARINREAALSGKPLRLKDIGVCNDPFLYAVKNPRDGRAPVEPWAVEHAWRIGCEIRGEVKRWNSYLNTVLLVQIADDERGAPAPDAPSPLAQPADLPRTRELAALGARLSQKAVESFIVERYGGADSAPGRSEILRALNETLARWRSDDDRVPPSTSKSNVDRALRALARQR